MENTKLGFLAIMPLLILGCGNSFNCAIFGDNIRGHVMLGPLAPVSSSRKMVVEVSSDGFSTVSNIATVDNFQSMVVVPYTVCGDTGKTLSVRAFVDQGSSGTYVTGAPSGRYDGTSDGNAAYKTINFPTASSSSKDSSSSDWKKDYNIDIAIDTVGGQ